MYEIKIPVYELEDVLSASVAMWDLKVSLNRMPGVYALIHHTEVIYVGMSGRSVPDRIKQHQKDKLFDRVFIYKEDDKNRREAIEMILIHKLRPRLNKQIGLEAIARFLLQEIKAT